MQSLPSLDGAELSLSRFLTVYWAAWQAIGMPRNAKLALMLCQVDENSYQFDG